jgi:DNA-binding response OmpR family regulator
MAARRILVIEDDSGLAALYRTALSSAGFAVDAIGDGLTALEEIDESHPDLVILDLQLPQIDGSTILRELLAAPDTRGIPVIVVTGSDAAALPADSTVLRKPFDVDLLLTSVEQHFHRAAA